MKEMEKIAKVLSKHLRNTENIKFLGIDVDDNTKGIVILKVVFALNKRVERKVLNERD